MIGRARCSYGTRGTMHHAPFALWCTRRSHTRSNVRSPAVHSIDATASDGKGPALVGVGTARIREGEYYNSVWICVMGMRDRSLRWRTNAWRMIE